MNYKSELNMLAAKDLLKNCHYQTVCHPAYYSCFQMIKYRLDKDYGVSYDEQDRLRVEGSGNSHKVVLGEFKKIAEKKKGWKFAQEFDRKIKDLQQERVNSDYKPMHFDREKCQNVISLAEELLRLMKI